MEFRATAVGPNARERSPADVMQDHLFRWRNRDIEGTLARNYDRDVLIVTSQGVRHGWSATRTMERALDICCAVGGVEVERFVVDEGLAVAIWRVDGSGANDAQRGIDTFFIRGGRIRLQTRELMRAAVTPERSAG